MRGAGDTHEYVLALVARRPGGDPKTRLVTTVSVGDPQGDPVRFEAVPLVDPSDGSPITSIIIAVRVPAGHQVLLAAGTSAKAVDLRTGRLA